MSKVVVSRRALSPRLAIHFSSVVALVSLLSLLSLVACSSTPKGGDAPAEVDATAPVEVPDASGTFDAGPADVEVDAGPPPPTCTDGVKNGDETDKDCGGSCGTKCADALECKVGGDCASTFCHPTNLKCTAVACDDGFKNGSESDTDCGGTCTAKCDDTQSCTVAADCKSVSCNATALKCEPATCGDNVKNGSETDKDCGGTCATKCADTQGCTFDGDCTSTFCNPTTNKCVAPSCSDGFKNADETDKDCGGATCGKCADALDCKADADCTSTFCNPITTKCVAPACDDGFKNASETDKDCGGSCATKCVDEQKCSVHSDCAGGFCNPTTNQCATPGCSDGFKNGTETDKDCGGSVCSKCDDTFVCAVSSDCASTFCNPATLKCVAPACDDGYLNGNETDKDCGGSCTTKCADAAACLVDADCGSGFCHPTTGKCVAPACDDTFTNGAETDKDCGGGTCSKCADTLKCKVDGDCTNTFCNPLALECATPTCSDGYQNQNETDVDCGGGTCTSKCADTRNCKAPSDCLSGFCNPSTLACATPTCSDGYANGAETDLDCGGPCTTKCTDTQGCKLHADCTSGFCNPSTLKCAAPACNDGYQNGTETDKDCGGSCSTACDDGLGCGVAGDCKSGVCDSLQCQTPTCDDGVKNGTETNIDCGGSCKNCPTTIPTVGDAPTLKDTMAFLFTGPNAVQKGVTATFEPVRFSVIRGRVLNRDGTPLAGVTVNIKNRPEFGTTTSQPDGFFDFAVNGGGGMTLEYQKSGVLPITRVIDVPWHDFASVSDAVMVPLDTAVTTVDFSAPVTTHQGTKQTDAAGDRQATLIFSQGTTVTMTMPNGSTQPLNGPLHVRATELTVGDSGPDAMPGELPQTSGYTYAAEFSVDEAMAAGASRVNFSKPVVTYVDNFLLFPVGSIVPAGYYDRDKDAWIGSQDGRAIKIQSITGGMADLVVDKAPAGIANATRLAQLGITDEERTELAAKFAVGKELWRVVVDHFTPWDYNWPKVPEAGAKFPNLKVPTNPNGLVPDCDECNGSIIEAQNQTLGEALPLVGTSEALHYRSDRSKARVRSTLTIPITEATVPPSLQRVEVKIAVAGRTFTTKIGRPLSANQNHTFTWDGIDAWGRPLSGAYKAKIKISHIYRAMYAESSSAFGGAFAKLEKTNPAGAGGPTGIIEADKTRGEIKLSQEQVALLEAGDVRRTGLGGWSLTSHHVYSPDAKELLFGDGRRRMADAVTQSVVNFQARIVVGYRHSAWTMGPDGTIYFREYPYYGSRIWKRTPQGVVTPIIGSTTMSAGCGAAGLQGSQTQIASSVAMAVSPLDGLLYYAQADTACPGIRRLRADGVVENVTAASSNGVESGVGGPASAAQLPSTAHIVFGPDGTLYIAAGFSTQPVTNLRMTGIYTIAPDGILRRLTKATATGSESQPYCYMTEQNNIPLANAVWPSPISYIDVDKEGRILFSQQCSIKKVENGIVTTVAGAGYGPAGPFCQARCAGSLSMGVPALSADASGPDKPYSDAGARAVAWDGRGGFYFATAGGGTGYGESQGDRIRHVTAEGIVESYMGDGTLNISDNNGRGGGMPAPALKPGVDGAWIVGGMKLGPDGALRRQRAPELPRRRRHARFAVLARL